MILVVNEKDNFHILIFSIDKTSISDNVVSTILVEVSLSKGGGRWGKTFKNIAHN